VGLVHINLYGGASGSPVGMASVKAGKADIPRTIPAIAGSDTGSGPYRPQFFEGLIFE
jgi:hypothetical protein